MDKTKLIQSMHNIMLCMNNEDAYSEWVRTMPDCADDEDIKYIAEDSELYIETVQEFIRIFKGYADDGLYVERINVWQEGYK